MAKITENARAVLEKRYLMRDASGELIEDATGMFRRVADAVAQAEPEGERAARAAEFFAMMDALDFVPNTPCLVNAGRPGGTGQLSACFVLPVDDSLDGIFGAVHKMAKVHQSGGGTGFSFSRLRPKGDVVSNGIGAASGPLSFMRVFNAGTEEIKQGGVRRGANMGILRVDHPDILEFIRVKLDPQAMQNFNLSVGITGAFMAARAADLPFELVNPRTGKATTTVSARFLWDELVRCAHATGDPGIVFLDRINAADRLRGTAGLIEATNPCGEVPLLPNDACTLGSINLDHFLVKSIEQLPPPDSLLSAILRIDLHRLEDVVRSAVRFLDDVLSVSRFPTPEIAETVAAHRKIGLGVMGWADLLIRIGVPYGSKLARDLAGRLMETIARYTEDASAQLARERGPFPIWTPALGGRRRNSSLTVIAPTGSISIIAGCSSGIEPLFALSMTRQQAGMTMTEMSPHVHALEGKLSTVAYVAAFEAARESGSIASASLLLPDSTSLLLPEEIRDVHRIASELTMEEHVLMQAAWQAHVDDAVSKTINLPHAATVEDVAAAYQLAWDHGCKGITVYRDGCRSGQVLSPGVQATESEQAAARSCATCGDSRGTCRHTLTTAERTEQSTAEASGSRIRPVYAAVVEANRRANAEVATSLGRETRERFIAKGRAAARRVHDQRRVLTTLANCGGFIGDLFIGDPQGYDVSHLREEIADLDGVMDGLEDGMLVARRSFRTGDGPMRYMITASGRLAIAELDAIIANNPIHGEAATETATEAEETPVSTPGGSRDISAPEVGLDEAIRAYDQRAVLRVLVRALVERGPLADATDIAKLRSDALLRKISNLEAVLLDLAVAGHITKVHSSFMITQAGQAALAALEDTIRVMERTRDAKTDAQWALAVADAKVDDVKIEAQWARAVAEAKLDEAKIQLDDMRAQASDAAQRTIDTLARARETATVPAVPRPRAHAPSWGDTARDGTVMRGIPEGGVHARESVTMTKRTPYGNAHVTVSQHPLDGEPFELFINLGKSGSEVKAWTEAFGRALSYLMSIPSPVSPSDRLRAIAGHLVGIGGGISVGFGADAVASAPDAIAKLILAYLDQRAAEPAAATADAPAAGPAAPAAPEEWVPFAPHDPAGREERAAAPAPVAPVVLVEKPVRSAATTAQRQKFDLCPSCKQAGVIYTKRCGECVICGWSKC